MSPSIAAPAWRQIMVTTARTGLAEAVFERFGACAVSILDAGDAPSIEQAPHAQPVFAVSRVVGLFPAERRARAVTDALHETLGPDAVIDIQWLEQRDWAHAWIDHHPPLYFGQRLWIAPHGVHVDTHRGDQAVRLDPGLAFGTGTHPTTALCLEWLAHADVAGLEVLDYGCGSGILAIAAARLGAARVTAVDIDPQAIRATRDNARANDMGQRIMTLAPDRLGAQTYDIVFANILARPLIELATTLIGHLRPGGRLVLSGLLSRHVAAMRSVYGPRVTFAEPARCDDWVRLDGALTDHDRDHDP